MRNNASTYTYTASACFSSLMTLVCVLAALVFSYARLSAQDNNAGQGEVKQVAAGEGVYSYDFKVYFRYDKANFDETYLTNRATLDRLDQVIARHGAEVVSDIELFAFSSPEGSASYNKNLSRRRVEAMRDYLVERYPALASKITLSPRVEAWDDFREILLADNHANPESKKKVLAILDKGYDNARLKKELKKLPDYDRYYSKYFSNLRYSAFRLSFPYEIEPEPEPEPVVKEESAPIEMDAVASSLSATPVANTLALPAAVEAPELNPLRVKWPLFAVSTNVLQDLLITPNFMIEVPIGKHWSVYGEYTFPWWLTKGNDRAWQILKWDLGARYYPFHKFDPADPMDILRGHFFGVEFSAGYYDIEPKHKGYQGEFQVVGLEYGYAWRLAQCWRLDAFIGAGWMGTHYRYYEGNKDDSRLIYKDTHIKPWNFGPIKLGVSIKYIIPYYRVKKEKKK